MYTHTHIHIRIPDHRFGHKPSLPLFPHSSLTHSKFTHIRTHTLSPSLCFLSPLLPVSPPFSLPLPTLSSLSPPFLSLYHPLPSPIPPPLCPLSPLPSPIKFSGSVSQSVSISPQYLLHLDISYRTSPISIRPPLCILFPNALLPLYISPPQILHVPSCSHLHNTTSLLLPLLYLTILLSFIFLPLLSQINSRIPLSFTPLCHVSYSTF